MWRQDLGREVVLRERRLDARDEIAAIGFIIGVLELTPAAFGEVTARRLLVVRPWRKGAVVEQRVAGNSKGDMPTAWRHAIAARRDPDNRFVHNRSSASGIAFVRSSAIMYGPAASAARP